MRGGVAWGFHTLDQDTYVAADPTSLTFPGPFRTYAGALAAKSAETSSLGKDPAR